jgi:multiple sugar transport system ATP-binding protein
MVFQDYALYPHMTVFGNISLSLRARRVAKVEIADRVKRVAQMLGIETLLERYPRQLSGGQRQRVAIGRAIVRNPRVFLFDEPLSNLDAQLRDEMRGEIKRLHQEIATTMIYVTHDQVEAMTLADRIVLLRDGVIEQQGAPLDLFEQPATLFVAGFLGSPRMNFLKGRLERGSDGAAVRLGEAGPALALPRGRIPAAGNGSEVILGLRPEHIGRAGSGPLSEGYSRIEAAIELVQPTGSRSYATFRLAEQPVMGELQAHDVSRAGERIALDINLRRAALFDPATGKAM